MTVSALALAALTQLVIAQTPREVVVLPLSTKGVKAADGLDAWNVVTTAVEKNKRRLKASTSVQKKQHDFLVGPAREQARDCGFKDGCLTEVGTTLGANILVAGRVEKKAITLIAIDVATGTRIGLARSQKKDKKARANQAAARLVRVLKRAAPKAAAAVAANTAAEKGASSATKPPPEDMKVDDPPEKSGDTTKPVDEPGGGAVAAASGTGTGTADPPAPTAGSSIQGTLTIAADQLRGVQSVSIDGAPIPFSGDGTVSWTGAVGAHRLVAKHIDGRSMSKDVRIAPNDTTVVVLEFPNVAPPPPAATTSVSNSEPSVLGAWWFWASIGTAIAAGTTTAALLAFGEKGGPAIPSSSGSIRGTY